MADYSITSFAERLGVSKNTVSRLIHKGHLNSYRVGRTIRIPEVEYGRFVLANSVEADEAEIKKKSPPLPPKRRNKRGSIIYLDGMTPAKDLSAKMEHRQNEENAPLPAIQS